MSTPASTPRAIIRTLRPHQWIKNLFVLAPLFFSKAFVDIGLTLQALLAALLFSLVAGAVYTMNDLFDVEKDRRHPVKKFRPIAAGDLSVGFARVLSGVLGPGSVILGFVLDWRVGAILGAYLVMNLAYSFKLKHVPYLDVSIIAIGFVMRVMAGAWAIDVLMSNWLIICTFLLAIYLALGKRMNELKLVESGRAEEVRKVLKHYNSEHLNFAVLFVSGLTIASYTIYTLSSSLPDQPLRSVYTPFHSPYLPLTIPFTVLGITRFYLLLSKDTDESPTELILRDIPFVANLVVWGGVMTVLYFL
ncbi:decaprenyl-phosphate phosphoribosyltransferase [Microvenator marinus]|uniref:Decaprenyl-phosphate phosphoribosyltransferase n=1 Tax=Microvenator marinus TaxID=2600177 RepID=A0A5B8XPC2_9DELT|nr:decaprenyl-phosphate phosphoribosyltransferase [Microvenator marinus]QED27500.1 decaprenyl-phosphate phosphoribosyltransferase [Microvenator marinus]